MSEQAARTESIEDLIAECLQSGGLALDISNMGLKEIPESVFRLSTLMSLSLHHNKLSKLPDEISLLRELTALNISDNRLQSLPSSVYRLEQMTSLHVSNNAITSLPDSLGQLTQLEVLEVSDNRLSSLPNQLGKCKGLTRLSLGGNKLRHLPSQVSELENLHTLFLSDNEIESLPASIARLRNLEVLYAGANRLETLPEELQSLTRLHTLTLWRNRLRVLPKVVCHLQALATLDLDSNHIQELPPEIGLLRTLDSLQIRGNALSALPAEIGHLQVLKSLDIGNNQITSLGPELARLPALERVSLDGNPLSKTITDAAEQGVKSLQALLASLSEHTQPIYEAKLLMTGEGQVGKSWTLAQLQGRNPTEAVGSDNTTWGIERGELCLPHPKVAGAKIHFNTWDFGGQKIYRVTHQFFFSEQALYILVWNPRQGAEQCRVREWLRMIAVRTGWTAPLSSGGDQVRKPSAKVIMVATHAQAEGGSYNPDFGKASLDADLQDMIVDEVEVDSKTGFGIDRLRDSIAIHASALPDMGQPLNSRWAAARDAVLALRENKPWISFQEFAEVAALHDVTDEEELRTLAWTYLHRLGRAIWYGSVSAENSVFDDPLLSHTIVLDAVWLSRAFVQVLDDEATKLSGGMLDHKRLIEIWTTHGRNGWRVYAPAEYEILKLVMRRFDVALPTRESNGTRSLVPQLVPFQRPKIPWVSAAEADGDITVRLSCKLDYEAAGLMARLIAATEPWHVYVEGTGLFWEEGIFLHENASFDNQALVTVRGSEKPRIDLVASGDQPSFLMHELYRVTESVLAFWRGMTRKYFILCPTRLPDGSYCEGSFSFEAIRRRVSRRISGKFDCEECDSVWSARQLLHGFEAIALTESYMIQHLYSRDQLLAPKTFLLEPAEKSLLAVTSWAGFIGSRFKITLISELSGKKLASKEFTLTNEWVKWVKPVTRMAAFALTGAALPITGDLAVEFQEAASMLDKISSLPGDETSGPDVVAESDGKGTHISKAQLANFAKFLNAIGLNPREHGMDIGQAADGRWLWMSSDEVEAYTPQDAAAIPNAIVDLV